MRHLLAFIVIAAFVALGSGDLFAQGKGAGRAHGPKTTTMRGGKAPQGQGGKTTRTKTTATTRAPKTKTAGPKSTAGTGRTSTTARADKGKKTTTSQPATATTPSALPKNAKLVERLRLLLPANTDMSLAAAGFKSQGQFVATVHVADNLGLSFAELKTRMVERNMSLGQAIQDLRPGVDATTAVQRATTQANEDLAAPRPRRNTRQ